MFALLFGAVVGAIFVGCIPPSPGDGNANGNSNSNTNTNSSANFNANAGLPPIPAPPTAIAVEEVVRTGDAVPGQPAAAFFTAFGNPIVDEDGRIAFWAQFDDGDGVGGLFVWDGVDLINVIDDDPDDVGTVPGRDTDDFFGPLATGTNLADPFALPMIWGSEGRLLFVSPIGGETDSRGLFRWRASDENLIRVADLEQLTALFTAEFGNAVLDFTFGNISLSDNGVVSFAGNYTLLGNNVPGMIAFGTGVYTSNGTAISVIRDRFLDDQPVPSQTTAAAFTAFSTRTTQNPGGDTFYLGTYSNGTGTRGLYLHRGATSFVVLDNRAGSSFAGLPVASTVDGAMSVADVVSASNRFIAIDTRLTVGGATRNTGLIWSFPQNRFTELIGAGGQDVDAIISGVNERGRVAYLAGGRPHIPNGNTVQRLDDTLPSPLDANNLRWESGASMNSFNRVLLPYTRNPNSAADAVRGLALWTGTQLLIVADRGLSISEPDLFAIDVGPLPEQDQHGRSGRLNDADQFTFRGTLRGDDETPSTNDDIEVIYFGEAE
ncbi:MAG: hypothetical protein AB7N71_02995 [Phycisphaerae bacterium]